MALPSPSANFKAMLQGEELMAVARVTQARRRFNLTLKQLCLQQVARQEQLYVLHPGQSALLDKLPPLLKTDVLELLSNKLRYPSTEHRNDFVKKLIHCRLESFDFAVCETLGSRAAKIEIWQCLVEVSAESLRSVIDLTCRVRNVEFNLGPLLPFVAKLPRLETLKINSSCCLKGQLSQLVDAAPNLKTLHLNVHSLDEPQEQESLFRLRFLEELDLFQSFRCFQLPPLMENLLRTMPGLKVNCIRTHERMYSNESKARPCHLPDDSVILQHPLGLEHLSLAFHHKFDQNPQMFPNVQHLMLTETRPIDRRPVCDYTKLFGQLSTLNLRFRSLEDMAMPIVQLNGAGITSLVLEFNDEELVAEEQLDLYRLLVWCPRLTTLEVHNCGQTKEEITVQLPLPRDLPLRKLQLSLLCVSGSHFLDWVLRAPHLEEVSLWATVWTPEALAKAEGALRRGEIRLANMHTFHFMLAEFESYFCSAAAAFPFVASVLALCPNLHESYVDLGNYNITHKLQPLLKVINQS